MRRQSSGHRNPQMTPETILFSLKFAEANVDWESGYDQPNRCRKYAGKRTVNYSIFEQEQVRQPYIGMTFGYTHENQVHVHVPEMWEAFHMYIQLLSKNYEWRDSQLRGQLFYTSR